MSSSLGVPEFDDFPGGIVQHKHNVFIQLIVFMRPEGLAAHGRVILINGRSAKSPRRFFTKHRLDAALDGFSLMPESGLIGHKNGLILDGQKAKHAPQSPHHGVTEIRLQELVRAGTGDHTDAVLAAQPDRFR